MIDDVVPWLRQQIHWSRMTAVDAATEWPSGPDGDEAAAEVSSVLVGAHVVLNDPAAVMAQCEAHEALLDLHPRVVALDSRMADWCGECSGEERSVAFPCPTVRALALAYQHRPGYREEWRP